MAKEEKRNNSSSTSSQSADKSRGNCCCQNESKVMEGFKFGFGLYVAFLAGTVIVGGLMTLIWVLTTII